MLVRIKDKNIRIKNILFFIAHVLFPITFKAQCAMCRASLESTGDVAQGEAINDGIVYLMAIPYILVGFAGYYVYKMYKKKKS
ncbi:MULTISPECIES: hypothetical protein [Flavobacterium]|uniref:Uncharacterized protein n=2 Tax=Flavobacterium TaxID=237 RepID=A0AA94JNQ5_9FLAO|nr:MULTISPECIES: hypothetical protein [Flavobacterium]OXA83030.1 hypothetical protein B0A56_02755 [Flavobacterium columnare NBRC 100251 = ATCC 23463]AMA50187.1 hypothetical protein AWN65_12305 [Flavobacterium covae]AND64293.1 hypothetical protein AX766_07655 [Flavobacterium covae]MCH4834178.1 hypothetical protein [Flavobacterium columnare]MCJ1806790.1 hypothetical protein [Flavobacterium covae]